MNSLHDNDIHLFEDEHKYQLRSNPSITFNSVTELISKYFEPFNKDSVASKLINTHPKYFGMTKVELIKQWDERRDHGSKIHKEIEDFIKSGKVATEQKSLDAIDWLERNSLEKELQSEAIIFSKELKIAGSIDVLIHDKKNNSYVILDWKTSKSIPKTSFNGKMGIHPATRHLMDCKFIHYSMQLSFYRYILEMYYGLLISDQLIAHLDGNSCTIHRAHYHKNEIMKIISSEKKLTPL